MTKELDSMNHYVLAKNPIFENQVFRSGVQKGTNCLNIKRGKTVIYVLKYELKSKFECTNILLQIHCVNLWVMSLFMKILVCNLHIMHATL